MNDVDRLKTLARILLSALEENQQLILSAPHLPNASEWEDVYEDNEEVIKQAHQILLDFPA